MANETMLFEQEFAKIPQNMGDYDELVAQGVNSFGIKERVFRYGCEWESKVENNTYAPATLNESTGVITPDTTHWRHVSGSYEMWLVDHDYGKLSAANVKDVNQGNKSQQTINSEVGRKVADLETAVGTGGTVDQKIAVEKNRAQNAESALGGRVTTIENAVGSGGSVDSRIAAAKTEIKGSATSACDTLGKAEALISAEATARANAVSAEASRAQAAEQSITTTVTSRLDTQDAEIALLNGAEVIVVEDHTAVSSPDPQKIYREIGDSSYTDWMNQTGNADDWKAIATYNPGIEDVPTAGSNNLVKSGGVVKYIDNLRITYNDYYMDMQTKENTYFNYQIKKYVPENGWKASGFIPVTEGLIGAEHRSYIGRISLFDINRTFIKQIEFRSTYSGTQELSVIAVPENTAYFVFTEANASYDSISFVSNSALREMKKVAGYKIIQKVGMTQGQSVSISMPLDYLAKGTAFSIKINQSSSITDRQYSYTINGTTYNVNANEKPLVLLDSDMTQTLTVYFGASSVIGTGDIEVEVDVMGEEQLMNSKVEIVGITSPYLYFNQERNVSVKFDVLTYTYNSIRYSINYDRIKQNLGTIEKFDYNLMLKVPITFLTTTKILVIDPFEHSVKYIERDDLKFYQFVLLEYSVTGYVQGFYYDYYKNYLKNINGALVVDHLPLNICSEIETKECDEIIPAVKHNDFSFVYFSDDHRQSYKEIEWHPYEGKVTNMTSMAAYKVYQDTPANTILNCGDTGLSHTSVGGKEAAIEMLHYFETIPSEMQLYCQGNHDRGIEQPIMSRESFFCMAYKKLLGKEDVVFGNAPSSYFYKNFNEYKIRFVVLDMYDIGSELDPQYNDNAGYRQAQLEWLINNALVIENNWSVIIVTHSAPVSPKQGMSYNAGPNVNADALRKILEDFKSGSAGSISQGTGAFAINLNYDFSVQGARDVIGLFSGHCHVDNIVKINGINYVSIACGYIDVQLYIGEDSLTENLGTRVQNSMSAICLDYVSINKSQRTVSLKRIGFGNDRTFTY